ncbi:beta-ketoacyl-[acyl-carrier-protein] synthase family protein [Sorangium sp. So ce269]
MTRQPGVAVTGVGLVTPAGHGVDDNWKRLCSGEPTAARDPELGGLPVDFSCRVPAFDAEAAFGAQRSWRLDRFVQLALLAAREAIADARLDPRTWDGARVGVVIGCGAGGLTTLEAQHARLLGQGARSVSALFLPMSLINMVSGYVAMEFRATGPNLVCATACASGATAIGVAMDLVRAGRCDVALAGGTDAAVTPLFVAGFGQMGALSTRREAPEKASRPFDKDRSGFVIGEGAAMLILERTQDARARGAHVRACISGYGASADAHRETAPDPDGTGIERAIRTALADADVSPSDITHVNAHGTSTRLNDLIEARVLRRVLGDAANVTSSKGVTGHTLGAAGAIEAAYTALTIEHGVIPPTANLENKDPDIPVDVVAGSARHQRVELALSNSLGFGGQNAVLLMSAP